MIFNLQIKHRLVYLYNTRLLRCLFTSSRIGNMRYHKLFVLVFYIELWYLLFIDEDSPLFFNPKNIDVQRVSDRDAVNAFSQYYHQ